MQSNNSMSKAEKKKKRLSITSQAGMTIKQLVPSMVPENSATPSANLNSSIAIEGTKHLMNLIELLSTEVDNLKISLTKEREEKELMKEWVQDLISRHIENKQKIEIEEQATQNKTQTSINFDDWLQDRNEQIERIKATKVLKKPNSRIPNSLSLTSSSTYHSLTSSMPNIPNIPYIPHSATASTPILSKLPPPPTSNDNIRNSNSKVDLSLISQCPLPPPIINLPEENNQNNSYELTLTEFPASNEKGLKLVNSQIPGYTVEDGFRETPNTFIDSYDLIESELEIPYYAKFFYNKPHSILMWEDPEKGEILFLTLPAINEQKDDTKISVIITTFNGNKLLILKGTKDIKKRALQAIDLNPSVVQLREIKDLSIRNQLLSMEAREIQIRKRYKFGVLYAKENQNENEMFSNRHGSEEFERFLDLLGERINLCNWTKYTGGLDNKTDTTGTNSVYTAHRGVEIMFHVSTLLPFGENDDQQLERKRHLGNDVVLIIFKEGNSPFSPKIIRSHFNCIFIVVQIVPNAEITPVYQIAVIAKEGIAAFPPILPDPPIFKKEEVFRDYLLTKCINGERSAMHSPEFGPRLARARIGAMQLMAKEFSKKN